MTGRLAPRRSIAGVYTMSARLKCLQARAGIGEGRTHAFAAYTHLQDNFYLGDAGSAYQAGRAHVSQDLCTCDSPTSLICPAAQVTDPAVWAAQAQ